jgi:hypothetical protein
MKLGVIDVNWSYTQVDMTHSTTITTPMPTWDEIVDRLALSKDDQDFVIRLVNGKGSRGPSVAFRKARATSSAPTRNDAPTESGPGRKNTRRVHSAA